MTFVLPLLGLLSLITQGLIQDLGDRVHGGHPPCWLRTRVNGWSLQVLIIVLALFLLLLFSSFKLVYLEDKVQFQSVSL